MSEGGAIRASLRRERAQSRRARLAEFLGRHPWIVVSLASIALGVAASALAIWSVRGA